MPDVPHSLALLVSLGHPPLYLLIAQGSLHTPPVLLRTQSQALVRGDVNGNAKVDEPESQELPIDNSNMLEPIAF